MSKYSEGLIYKLCCNDPNIHDIYVGSTTNFAMRFYSHKSMCHNQISNSFNHYKYKFIRDNGGFGEWTMQLIEKFPCKNVTELHTRERFWYDQLNCTLNKAVPAQTAQEYYEVNRHIINEKKREPFLCECGSWYTLTHKARHLKTKKHLNFINTL